MFDMYGRFPAPLHCPYCGADLEIDAVIDSMDGQVVNGVVRCACFRYPILEGIPILRQTSTVGSNLDPVVRCIRQRDIGGAIAAASGQLVGGAATAPSASEACCRLCATRGEGKRIARAHVSLDR